MTSPPTRRPRRLLALAAVSALLVSCSDGGDEITLPSPSPTTPAETPSAAASPSPSPSEPFAVPDEITAEYVERVLNEINRLDAEITKDILQAPTDEDATELGPELESRLAALYAPPLEDFNRQALLDLLRSPDQRDDLLPPEDYGQQRAEVEEVLISDGPCVASRITTDVSETDAEVDPATSTLSFGVLVRSSQANPTGWKLARSLTADVEAGSTEEEELRSLTAKDLEQQLPEVCQQ